jgi:hypothetical protein
MPGSTVPIARRDLVACGADLLTKPTSKQGRQPDTRSPECSVPPQAEATEEGQSPEMSVTGVSGP